MAGVEHRAFPRKRFHPQWMKLSTAATRLSDGREKGGREMPERYDVIIVGSGAGGGTLAHTVDV
jgi:hypothetical protein